MRPLPNAYRLSLIALIALTSTAFAGSVSDKRKAELSYLVVQDCGSCHGMTLKGGLGSALTPAELEDSDTEALASIILDGIPDVPMPPWRGLISEDEANWIAGALKKGTIK